mmetsp:Transcript_13973/g.25165  ORF Transcript_13973/g.25165 Transcript_13973/m.25165 type:complete len:85 (+) Transcript_13973:451-705(+)
MAVCSTRNGPPKHLDAPQDSDEALHLLHALPSEQWNPCKAMIYANTAVVYLRQRLGPEEVQELLLSGNHQPLSVPGGPETSMKL